MVASVRVPPGATKLGSRAAQYAASEASEDVDTPPAAAERSRASSREDKSFRIWNG